LIGVLRRERHIVYLDLGQGQKHQHRALFGTGLDGIAPYTRPR
jgi:hypothetical protein